MKPSGEKTFYRWTRDLHLYLGLLVSPFVIAFAVSVLFLNHAKVDGRCHLSHDGSRREDTGGAGDHPRS